MNKDDIVLLHIDDSLIDQKDFSKAFLNSPFRVISCSNESSFYEIINIEKRINVAVIDIFLEDSFFQKTGFELAQYLRQIHPYMVILIYSSLDDPLLVLNSLRVGADEFLSKNSDKSDLPQRILDLIGVIEKKRNQDIFQLFPNCPIVGHSMGQIAARIPALVSSAISAVYVEGESGTGKEVVADLFKSYLKTVPFLKLNCGGIAENLLESELFGYQKGSFTGALQDKKGMIEAADGGWLFLDEVSSLSWAAQTALLRVLENQEVLRIGETLVRRVNVRFLIASNIPLHLLVQRGKFRNDLWQRFQEAEIFLSPLRERPQEIRPLVEFFCQTMRGGPYRIEESALKVLCLLSWENGNVRELRNCLRAMTEHHNRKVLSPMNIPERILTQNTENAFESSKSSTLSVHCPQVEDTQVSVPIRDAHGHFLSFDKMTLFLLSQICKIVVQEEGKINQSRLSKDLKMSRSSLLLKIKEIQKNTLF